MLRGLRQKSVDEFLALEEEIMDQVNDDGPLSFYNAVVFYRMFLNKVRRDRKHSDLRGSIERNLVKYLIEYGSYLKNNEIKDDGLAEASLEEALKINNRIPIAHYRLGFLNYDSSPHFVI